MQEFDLPVCRFTASRRGAKLVGVAVAVLMLFGLAGCRRAPSPATAVPWTILLSTAPNPPTIPGNTFFKALVMDSAGDPVTGATVTVNLVATTMDMGPNQVTLLPHADGIYTGSAGFTMPGSWVCKVTVKTHEHSQTQTFPFTVVASN